MRYVRATTATHTRSASTAAPMRDALAAATTRARSATPAAAMRYVLTATDTLAGIAAATMRDVLATVHCTIMVAKTNSTTAGINNPLATAAAKIQPLLTATAITDPLLDMRPAVPVISYGTAATRSVYRDVVSIPIDVAAPITARHPSSESIGGTEGDAGRDDTCRDVSGRRPVVWWIVGVWPVSINHAGIVARNIDRVGIGRLDGDNLPPLLLRNTTFCCSVVCNLLLAWALARRRWMASITSAC
jgi:hypothetical protein